MSNNLDYVIGDPNMLWDRFLKEVSKREGQEPINFLGGVDYYKALFLKGAEVTEEEFEKWYGGKKNVDTD